MDHSRKIFAGSIIRQFYSKSTRRADFTLWHSPSARSLRCLWTAEELGLTGYNLITMPFPPRVTHKEFLKKNVLGTIPYFENGDSKMTESTASKHANRCNILQLINSFPSLVCQYLVTKYGPTSLAIDTTESDYGQYLNWLYHADATLTFPQTIVLRYTLQQPGRADEAARDYAKWYIARLRMLDTTLSADSNREYLVGNRFTIADICIAYALYLGKSLKVDGVSLASRYQPDTMRYMERMTGRDGFKAAIALQKSSLADFLEKHPPVAPLPESPVS
jgi:glutathione S-transferase